MKRTSVCLAAICVIAMLTSDTHAQLGRRLTGGGWTTVDTGWRLVTPEPLADEAPDVAKLTLSEKDTKRVLPGDRLRLTVIYGDNEKSTWLKRHFDHGKLTGARKQFIYSELKANRAPDASWRRYYADHDVDSNSPVIVMSQRGVEELCLVGSDIRSASGTEKQLLETMQACLGGFGRHRSPPAEEEEEEPVDDTAPVDSAPQAPVVEQPAKKDGVDEGMLWALGGLFLVGSVVFQLQKSFRTGT